MERGGTVLGLAVAIVVLILAAGATLVVRRGGGSSDLQDLVRRHVAAMPGRGSGGYRRPTAAERQAAGAAWRLVEQGAIAGARATLRPFGYTVQEVKLIGGSGPGTAISGPGGLFIYRPGGSDLVVEVPHPIADSATEVLGVELFNTARASALLVAGAHRAAAPDEGSDVAHEPSSAFHAMHVAATASERTAVQLHGFAQYSAPGLDVIVSSGGPPESEDTAGAVAARLSGRFRTCRWAPTSPPPCAALGGTRNAQVRQTRAVGGEFVHLEVGRKVRISPVLRRALVKQVATALRADQTLKGHGA